MDCIRNENEDNVIGNNNGNFLFNYWLTVK